MVERRSDREALRRKYETVRRKIGDELFDQVSAALFSADLRGINFGHNTDEYEPEVATILPRLAECHSVQDAQTVIQEEFLAWFGIEADEPAFAKEFYAQLAEQVWDLWQRHRLQRGD
jgi:hypothetical protein